MRLTRMVMLVLSLMLLQAEACETQSLEALSLRIDFRSHGIGHIETYWRTRSRNKDSLTENIFSILDWAYRNKADVDTLGRSLLQYARREGFNRRHQLMAWEGWALEAIQTAIDRFKIYEPSLRKELEENQQQWEADTLREN